MKRSINERKAWKWSAMIVVTHCLGNLGLALSSNLSSLWAIPFNTLTLLCGIFMWYQGYRIGWEYKRLSIEEDS